MLYVYNSSTWTAAATTCTFLNDKSVSTSSALILDLDFESSTAAGADDKFIRFLKNSAEVGSVNSQVVYSTFTGGHIGQSEEDGADWLPGMIVCVTENDSSAPALASPFFLKLSNRAYDKSAIGVFTGIENDSHRQGIPAGKPAYGYNALGDGLILVTDQGGDIQIGDYITTSDLPGYGMKQNDNLLHNYSVAKATEAVIWKDIKTDAKLGIKWKLLPCTYHGG
jgi:hypothetical protein